MLYNINVDDEDDDGNSRKAYILYPTTLHLTTLTAPIVMYIIAISVRHYLSETTYFLPLHFTCLKDIVKFLQTNDKRIFKSAYSN